MNRPPTELTENDAQSAKSETTTEQGNFRAEAVSFFKTLALLILAAIFLRASVVEAFKIPSGSMKPTLLIGDHILVSKLSYGIRLPFLAKTLYQFSEPRRGDVVVFTRPDDPSTHGVDESDINIIKRVIGLPGDVVKVEDTDVFVNGQRLDEKEYARWLDNGSSREGEYTVSPGTVFLLGDNRDHSKDSRYWEPDHFLPIERIKGRALFIYWTWDSSLFERIGKVIR